MRPTFKKLIKLSESQQNHLADIIKGKLLEIKKILLIPLNNIVARFSSKQKKYFLLNLIIFMSVTPSYLLYKVFSNRATYYDRDPIINHLSMPVNIHMPDSLNIELMKQEKNLLDTIHKPIDSLLNK